MSSISLIQKPSLDLVALVFDCCTDQVWDGDSFEDLATQGVVFPTSNHYQPITNDFVISTKQTMYLFTPTQDMIDESTNGCLRVMYFDVTDDQSTTYGCLAGSGCYESCNEPVDTGCVYQVTLDRPCYAPGQPMLITGTKKCNGLLEDVPSNIAIARINGTTSVPLTYLTTGIYGGISAAPAAPNGNIVLIELLIGGNVVCAITYQSCDENELTCLTDIKAKLSGDAPDCEQGELTPQEMLVGLYEYIICESKADTGTGGGSSVWTSAQVTTALTCLTDIKAKLSGDAPDCEQGELTPQEMLVGLYEYIICESKADTGTGGGSSVWTSAQVTTALTCLTDIKQDIADSESNILSELGDAVTEIITEGNSNWTTGAGGTTTWTPAEKAALIQCVTDLKTDVSAIPTTCPSVDTTPIIAAITAQTTHGDSNWSTGSGGTTTWTPAEKTALIQCVTDLKTDVEAIPTSCPDCICTGGGGSCSCPTATEIQMLLSACKTEIVTHGDTHWTCTGGSGGTPAGNVYGCC